MMVSKLLTMCALNSVWLCSDGVSPRRIYKSFPNPTLLVIAMGVFEVFTDQLHQYFSVCIATCSEVVSSFCS